MHSVLDMCNLGHLQAEDGGRSVVWGLIDEISGASLVAQMVKNLPAMKETWVQSLDWEDTLRREWQPTLVFLPGESHGQKSLAGYSP